MTPQNFQWFSLDLPSGAPLHTLSKLYDVPVGFVPPHPYFEAEHCLFCGRRRVAVARYRMNCLVLLHIMIFYLMYICVVSHRLLWRIIKVLIFTHVYTWKYFTDVLYDMNMFNMKFDGWFPFELDNECHTSGVTVVGIVIFPRRP